MPTLPNISHPKLDGRKIVPWGRFTSSYHQEEERLPFFLTERNEVWEARLFTQKRGSDAGTKKAEIRLLGAMTPDTYARFGITPPATAAAGPFDNVTGRPIATTPLPPATTPAANPSDGNLGAGPPQGTPTTGNPRPPANTTPNANTGNNTGSSANTASTSWADFVNRTITGAINTATGFINSLNIPGVNLPITPPTTVTDSSGNANNTTGGGAGQNAGGSGNPGDTPPPPPAAGATTNMLLLAGAAGVGLWLLLRKK